jgi:hypothetical protein
MHALGGAQVEEPETPWGEQQRWPGRPQAWHV